LSAERREDMTKIVAQLVGQDFDPNLQERDSDLPPENFADLEQSQNEGLELEPVTTADKVKSEIGRYKYELNKRFSGLEKVPIPGNIATPLITLLTFFVVLIPFNGYTRIGWLWLALIGQAVLAVNNSGTTSYTPPQNAQYSGTTVSTGSVTTTPNSTSTGIGTGTPTPTYTPVYQGNIQSNYSQYMVMETM
jgi:hypothetical protein